MSPLKGINNSVVLNNAHKRADKEIELLPLREYGGMSINVHNMHIDFVTPTGRISKIYLRDPYRKQLFCIKSLAYNCQNVTKQEVFSRKHNWPHMQFLAAIDFFSNLYADRSLLNNFLIESMCKKIYQNMITKWQFLKTYYVTTPCLLRSNTRRKKNNKRRGIFKIWEAKHFSTYKIFHKAFFFLV